MKIGIIGCGWAFDIYMASWAEGRGLEIAGVSDSDPARLDVVCRHYGLRRYENNAALLADTGVAIVVNLTPPSSHYRVTKSALEAGKHVYSEKPLATDLEQARELFALAEANGLYLCCAPSNVLGDSAQTMWKAVEDGAVGDVRIVYAELDGSPLRLQRPETWRSKTGAPFPWAHELEMGCTWEHAGYYLSLMCAMFGPVKSVTAFSKRTVPDKMDPPLDPSDTPDFSVACLDFHSGIVGRLTCSIGPPWDHRFRVIGDKGMLATDTYRHYRCPVRLVGFTRLPMKGFQMASVRGNTLLQRLFGVNGRRLDLAGIAPPPPPPPPPRAVVEHPHMARQAEGTRARMAGQDARRGRTGRRGPRRATPLPAARFHLPRHRIDPRDPSRRRARQNPCSGIALRPSNLAGADAPECARLPGGSAPAASGASPRMRDRGTARHARVPFGNEPDFSAVI